MTMYGTIFYDANDSTYYVNPNGGTSAILNGEVEIRGPTGTTHFNYNDDGGYNYFRGYANYFDQNQTYIRDCRAYIYYDWNNTGYYADPASRSSFYELGAVGFRTRTGRNGGGDNWFNFQWANPNLWAWVDFTRIGVAASFSDYRLKKNIQTQTQPALERIMRIRPVTYEYDYYKDLSEPDGVIREGFIAHELKEVIPTAVDGEKDEENVLQSLRFDAICSVIVKALQELSEKVDSIEQRLNSLENI